MEPETPAKPEIAVLLVEDNDPAADAVAGILEGNWSTEFAVTRLQSAELALPLLQDSKFDAVLLSIKPSHDAALEAVSRIAESAAPAPVIALGQLPEAEIAVDLLRAGAEDYLPKSEAAFRALPRIVRYAVERHRLSDRLRRASDKRSEIQSLLGAILNTISTPVLIANDKKKVVMANPAVAAQFGWQRQEIVGCPVSTLVTKADAGTARFQCKDAAPPIPIRLSSVEVKIENRQWLVIACHRLDQASFGGFDFAGSFEQGLSALLQKQAGHLVAGRVQMVSVDEIANASAIIGRARPNASMPRRNRSSGPALHRRTCSSGSTTVSSSSASASRAMRKRASRLRRSRRKSATSCSARESTPDSSRSRSIRRKSMFPRTRRTMPATSRFSWRPSWPARRTA